MVHKQLLILEYESVNQGKANTTSTISVAPSHASISATGSNLGTTEKAKTTLKSQTVTWSANGKSATDTMYVYQQANTYSDSGGTTTYGNVTAGTITNATVPASGGTKTATAGNGSQTYSTTKKVRTFTSGSTTTLANATSGTNSISPSHASISATGSNLGTTVTSQQTLKSQTVTWTGNGGKSASGTMYVYQQANAKTSITYGTPSVSLSYSGNVSAAGGTKSPSYSYSQSRTQNYTSGSTSTLSSVTSGGTVSFSETTVHTASSVNSSTGVVSWSANTSTSSRSCGVTLTVTLNGKTGSKAATCTQNGDSISSSSTTYTISFSASPTSVGVGGGTVTLSYSGTSKTTNYWVSGDETSSTGSFTPTISGSATGFSRSGTTVTVSSNGGTASSRSVTYTASYSGATSKTVTITQSGDTTKNVTETEYSYSCSISASPTVISATGGTVTLSPKAYYSTRTRTNVQWVYAGTIKSYGTWGSWGSQTAATNYTISGSATGFSRSGNTVTVSKNSSTSNRSCTYTISYQGKTNSVTITQNGQALNRAFDFVVNDNQAIGWGYSRTLYTEGPMFNETEMGSPYYGGAAITLYEDDLPIYIYQNHEGIAVYFDRIISYPGTTITINIS